MLTDRQVADLKKLAASGELAMAVFKTLGTRERPRVVMDLRRLRQQILHEHNLHINTEEFMGLFKSLEQMKLGKLVLAKNPIHPHRFNWTGNSVEIGVAASGVKREAVSKPIAGRAFAAANAPAFPHINVPIPLRGEFLSISFPTDGLTEEEAAQINAVVKTFTYKR